MLFILLRLVCQSTLATAKAPKVYGLVWQQAKAKRSDQQGQTLMQSMLIFDQIWAVELNILIQILFYKMDNTDLKCCLCNQHFSASSQPRMMPYCQHSGCTSCIKKIISNKTATFLKCQHCGHQQNVQEVDLQYFPKNISLTKMIKQMSQSGQSKMQPKSSKEPENITTQEPKESKQPRVQLCKIHNKEIQIICITDKEKLCPHCALFGKHKDHNFKTLTEANLEMQQIKRYFQGCRKRKEGIDQRINSKEFKQSLIDKIGKQKDRLVSEIKLKFSNLYENIRLAEKQAFEDVVKHFKTIYHKIVALIKEENDSNLRYKQWEQRCAQLFIQANKLKTIQEKSFIYFGGPLEICKQGDIHLKKIQNKLDNNMLSIEKLITSIKVVDNVAAANSLFNYINIVVDSQDIQMVTQAAHEVIQFKEIKEEIYRPRIEVSSPETLPFLSPSKISSHRQITPRKKSSSKQKDRNLNRTSQKRNQAKSPIQNEKVTIEKMVQQFCERQNLDTLDLTGYNLNDSQILDVLRYLKPLKKIKGLKLVKNKLSNEGLAKIIQMIPTVTNLNVSFNQLGDQALGCILAGKQRIPMLRIINISNNKINQRKVRTTVEQLKRQGIIVTI